MLTLACIPAYNEERVISKVVNEVQKYVDKVVVCDDGSTDKTYENANSAGAKVIKLEKNKGKGAAMRLLFDYAKKENADVVVTIDGDGQFVPEEIPKLIKPVINDESDIVIGYRFDDKDEMPSYRRVGNKLLDKVSSLATQLPYRDTQSGFRSYSKKAIESIKITTNGFGADSDILIDASRKGLRISEEKVTVLYNTGEKTSTKNPVSHVGDVIYSIVETISIRQPLRYLGIPGLILVIIGIIYTIIVVSIFNDTRYFSVPSTLIALGSLVMGLILLLMSSVLFTLGRAIQKQT